MEKETQSATVTISYKLFESMKNELKTFKEDGLIYMSTKHGIKLYSNKEDGTKQIIEDLTKKFETELKTVHGVVSSCHKKIKELSIDKTEQRSNSMEQIRQLKKQKDYLYDMIEDRDKQIFELITTPKKSFWNIFKTK